MSEQSLLVDTPITPCTPFENARSKQKTIECTWEGCTKLFDKPARLASHLRSHKNERPFICSYTSCNKSYLEAKHLVQHIKGSHTQERQHHCNWEGCNKCFLTATRLRRHLDSHEGRERFKCNGFPPCTRTFRKHHTLQSHIRTAHLGLAPYSCPQADPITHDVCGAVFDSAAALRKHSERNHGPPRFWCDECSDTIKPDGTSQQVAFSTKRELEKHVNVEHSNCIFCNSKCNGKRELQKHIETYHSSPNISNETKSLAERKALPCAHPGCDKTFTKKCNLLVHVRVAHEGIRFVCSQTPCYTLNSPDLSFWTGKGACGKEFVSKVNLEDHIRTQHLGLPSQVNSRKAKTRFIPAYEQNESVVDNSDDYINILTGLSYGQNTKRKYPCVFPNCDWRFTRQHDLNRHIEAKHPVSIEEIWSHGVHGDDNKKDVGKESKNAPQNHLALCPGGVIREGNSNLWEVPLESSEAAELRTRQMDMWYPEDPLIWPLPQ